MLEQNPLYKIYKSGRIPVIRFKDEGFKDYNQNNYFSHKGTEPLEENCKDIQGCFCLIGGMQDSFILSGVGNTETLNIGSVDKNTKVFVPFGRRWEKAGKIFEENLKDIEKTYAVTPEGFKSRSIDSRNDDFDIFCSQAIIKTEDIVFEERIEEKDFPKIWHTMDDKYLKIASGLDFYYIAKKYGQVEDFLKYIDKKGLLKDLLITVYEEFEDSDIKNLKTLKRYNDLYKKYEKRPNAMAFLRNLAPEKLDEDTKNLDIFDSIIENIDIFPVTSYMHPVRLNLDIPNTKCCYMVKNHSFIIKKQEGEKEVDFDKNKIYLDRENIENLSNIIKQINLMSKFDNDCILTDSLSKTILMLNDFYKENNVELNNDGFIFENDKYKIEYNFILDDCIILDKSSPEKLLHEEDLILRGDLNDLSVIENFRKIFVDSLFEEIAI